MESEANPIRNQLAPALVTVALLLGLLGVDVWLGYRKMVAGNSDEIIQAVHRPHPTLGWVPQPGTGRHDRPGNFSARYGIDDDGLRHVDNAGEPVHRLWLFGDSFAFGHGVGDSDTFASVLAREWLAPGIHVRNAGVMGYGVAQEVQRLIELAGQIQPGDRVVFAPISVDVERSLKHFAHPSKYLFREEKGQIEGYPDLRDGKLVTVPFDTLSNRVRALLYNARFTGAGIQRLHHLVIPPQSVEETRELMQIARAVSEARGARFAWLFLPHPRELLADGYRADLSGLVFTDLKRFFPRDPDEVAAIHFPDDPHWNARGHALAAGAVAEALLQEGVLASDELAPDAKLTLRMAQRQGR